MNEKKYMKRKKLKRIIIAYLLRTLVILIAILMIILMICGCLYIYDRFTMEEETDAYAENETVIYEGDYDQVVYEDDYEPDSPASVEDNESAFCVVIDAGHGGIDGGTAGGEVIEKDINLSVALKLKAILEDNNIEVVLTRNSDEKVSLAERIDIANNANADFFISLHCNYYEDDDQIAGLECYYGSPDATESKVYAESIIGAVSSSDDVIVRTAKDEDYYVLRNTQMPAVLVEMGFLSNASEREKLSSDEYQEILSQKIAEGISAGRLK